MESGLDGGFPFARPPKDLPNRKDETVGGTEFFFCSVGV